MSIQIDHPQNKIAILNILEYYLTIINYDIDVLLSAFAR